MTYPDSPDSNTFDQWLAADLLIRQDQNEDDDEDEDEEDDLDEDDDNEDEDSDDGYSE
jgi:hypothetical protein